VHRSDDEQKEAALAVGFNNVLTPAQQACAVDLLTEQVALFNEAVEAAISAQIARDRARPTFNLGSSAKRIGSWFSKYMRKLVDQREQAVDEVEVAEPVDDEIELKKTCRSKLLAKYNTYLMQQLNASYIHMVSSDGYPNLQLEVDVESIVCKGDACSALSELKLLVFVLKSSVIKRRLRDLSALAVNPLMGSSLESLDAVSVAGGGGGSGAAARPIPIGVYAPWGRGDFSRPADVLVREPLGARRPRLLSALGEQLKKLNNELLVVSARIPRDYMEGQQDRDTAIASKNNRIFGQLREFLISQLESRYLDISQLPQSMGRICVSLRPHRVNCAGDIWFAAREIRLFAVLAALSGEPELVENANLQREIYYFEGLFNGLEGDMMRLLQEVPRGEEVVEAKEAAQAVAAGRGQPVVLEGSEMGEIAGALGVRPDELDLSVKVLVFGSAWSLTTALRFWSLVQGKTGKIMKARYGLDLLKALLMEQGQGEPFSKVDLLRDVTDVLFTHRIRRSTAPAQEADQEQEPGAEVLSVTKSGKKFAGLLLQQQNAYVRHLILENAVEMCEEGPSITVMHSIMMEAGVRRYRSRAGNLFGKHQEHNLEFNGDLDDMVDLLMQWSRLRYYIDHYQRRDPGELRHTAQRFFAADREPREILDRNPEADALITRMRIFEREQRLTR
jgi:hypothetical protein